MDFSEVDDGLVGMRLEGTDEEVDILGIDVV